MQSVTRWATVLALALGASACAYGVVDEPGDDDDAVGGGSRDIGARLGDPGGGSGAGNPGDGPSDGACYDPVVTGVNTVCNPMQEAGCGTGEACDSTPEEGFRCFPAPTEVQVGGVCDDLEGPFCAQGSTCVEGTCRAYCCTPGDCTFGTCQGVGSAGGIALRCCMP